MRKSILEGVDRLLAEHFGHSKTKTGAKKYLRGEQALESGYWEKIYKRISKNYKGGNDAGSTENWRFETVTQVSPSNTSVEKILEKTIAKWADEECKGKWANQVPVASGLVRSGGDKKRNVDLIQRLRKGEYEFVELKIGSNNPLYAAIEILVYGLLYIFYREKIPKEKWASKSDHDLLNASKIYLKVVAPDSYYEVYDRQQMKMFEKKCSETIQGFTERKIESLNMNFCFESFTFSKQMAQWFSENRKRL